MSNNKLGNKLKTIIFAGLAIICVSVVIKLNLEDKWEPPTFSSLGDAINYGTLDSKGSKSTDIAKIFGKKRKIYYCIQG